MNDLEKVMDLLHGSGEVMPGIDMTVEEALERARGKEEFRDLPYCIVRDWIWIDLIVPDQLAYAWAGKLQPVMLYAHCVLYDSNQRFNPGDWVRTSPLIAFTDDCFFRSRNTLYVLVGNGTRKRAELSTVASIF